MKVQVTIDLDEDARRAISHRFGKDRPATRDEIKGYVRSVFWGEMEDVLYEYGNGTSRPEDDEDDQ